MAKRIGAIGVEVPLESGFGSVSGHIASSCEGKILTTTDILHSFAYQSLLERSGRAERLSVSLMPLV